MAKIMKIQAVNGPYSPTADGIERAIGACLCDQELGKRPENSTIVVVFGDGSKRNFPVQMNDIGTEGYVAAEIAHELHLKHDSGICAACQFENELEDLEDLKDEFDW